MLQLTYISSVVPGVHVSIDEILRVSRRNNAAVGISGLLLYDGRRFLQAMEGESAAVVRTYDRIGADPRHRGLVLLSSREVAVRSFGDWAMAAGPGGPARGRDVRPNPGGDIVAQVAALTASVADPTMRELFRSFAKVRAAA